MKKNILKLSSLLCIVAAMSGCLKDKHYDNNEFQSLRYDATNQKVVSIALTTATPTTDPEFNVALNSFNASAALTTINLVPITIAGGVAATQDVHVVVDTSFAILNAYNISPTGSFVYQLPDPTKYSIVSKTVTIPAGQTTGYLQIKLVPNAFIAGPSTGFDAFGLGVKILSVDGGYSVAPDRKQGVAAFIINNEYAGTYLCNGVRTRYNGPTEASGILDPLFPIAGELNAFTTAGATSIKGPMGDAAGSGVTGVITIDVATNNVTVVGTAGVTPLGSNINNTVPSTYNPTTKTFTLHLKYLNAAGNLRTIEETMVKQ